MAILLILPRIHYLKPLKIMVDRKLITEKLEKALYLTSDVLMQSRIEGISSCIHGGEWDLAFEILCENLYEDELPISKEAYEVLEDIGSQLKTKEDYYKDLKPQIIPDS